MKPGPFDRTFSLPSSSAPQIGTRSTNDPRHRLVKKEKRGYLASRISPIELPPSFPSQPEDQTKSDRSNRITIHLDEYIPHPHTYGSPSQHPTRSRSPPKLSPQVIKAQVTERGLISSSMWTLRPCSVPERRVRGVRTAEKGNEGVGEVRRG